MSKSEQADTTRDLCGLDSSLVKHRSRTVLAGGEEGSLARSTMQLQTPLPLKNGGALSHYVAEVAGEGQGRQVY